MKCPFKEVYSPHKKKVVPVNDWEQYYFLMIYDGHNHKEALAQAFPLAKEKILEPEQYTFFHTANDMSCLPSMILSPKPKVSEELGEAGTIIREMYPKIVKEPPKTDIELLRESLLNRKLSCD